MIKTRLIFLFMMALSFVSCEESVCIDCDTEEFINEWWQVETDNAAAQGLIGTDCYSFMALHTYSDTGHGTVQTLYGYDHSSDPPHHWHVGMWEYGDDKSTFLIEGDYYLKLVGEMEECYIIQTTIHGVAINGEACPCEEKYNQE